MRDPQKRHARKFELPVTFQAEKDHVVAVMHAGSSSIGLRFESVEQMLTFFVKLMETAAQVWPDNDLVKDYLSDEKPGTHYGRSNYIN